jgi:CheY-like chemotaxis protein
MSQPAPILIIEDNADNLTLLQDILQSLGYRHISARDGEAGLDLVREQPPVLILLDLSLPRMDGWSVARALKGDPALKAIPVIALTAHAMRGDREKALEAGCDGFLTKPINLRELTSTVRRYVNPPEAPTRTGAKP